MHLRKQKKPNGRIYLSIVQSYRTPEGKTRSKTLWSLGYVDDLQQTHPDPIAHFQGVVDNLNSIHEEDQKPTVPVMLSPEAKIPFGTARTLEAGAAAVLSALHRCLRLDSALQAAGVDPARLKKVSRLTELLVWSRIAHPQLIMDAWAQRSRIPGLADLTRNDVFKGVELLGGSSEGITPHINAALESWRSETKNSRTFCLVSNFYIEESSWTHPEHNKRWDERKSPIVQAAIMVDGTGLPIDYCVSDSHLASALSPLPTVPELAKRHPDERLVVVTNKSIGTNTHELSALLEDNFGFVFLQSMRKGLRASREWVLDSTDYQTIGIDGSRYKERMSIRQLEDKQNSKCPSSIAVKEVAFWWREAFEYSRFDRFHIVKRNEDVVAHGAPSDGSVRPMRAVRGFGDAKPGDIGDRVWHVYWDKISADEAMDGFCNIITSELDLPANLVVNLYQNLFFWRSFFKPPWGEWSTCPGSVPRDSYLHAHFLICYLAACSIQLLLGGEHRFLSDSACLTLSRLTGREISPGLFFFDYRSRLSDALAEAANVDLSRQLVSATDLGRMMQEARKEP
ncbi:MAG: hypothetical protein IJ131_06100 [Eggerthellaceae bacterium]|nr:hypothetical protein [Eggerthellaceae bacterium]